MEFTIENDILKVTVTTAGAQVKSVLRKSDGVEHMWQADPAVWGYHAPILFPYTGRVKDGVITVDGEDYPAPTQHGFARMLEHTPVQITPERIVLELTETGQTLKSFPWRFRLMSVFTLKGDTLHHTLTVENRDDTDMPFGIGYHPAFAIPFDAHHTATDYTLRFDEMESPLCLGTVPKGLVNGSCYYLGRNIREIPITEGMFDNDSHCMVNLKSKTLGLYEKDTGRGVVCNIENFPYNLIWSKPGMPQFVCIEPWNSLPSPEDGDTDWAKKPAAAIVRPGEAWSTCLATAFVRPAAPGGNAWSARLTSSACAGGL